MAVGDEFDGRAAGCLLGGATRLLSISQRTAKLLVCVDQPRQFRRGLFDPACNRLRGRACVYLFLVCFSLFFFFSPASEAGSLSRCGMRMPISSRTCWALTWNFS